MQLYHSKSYKTNCQIIEEIFLWGETYYRVWLQNEDKVVQVSVSDLIPVGETQQLDLEGFHLKFAAAAGKIAQALGAAKHGVDESVLMAPLEANIILLPHQINALARAVSADQVRFLLADEVGLGKTIEAGLIMRELKMRGLVRRVLIVVPKSLATQWVAEMDTHFKESFQLVLPEDIRALNRLQTGLFDVSQSESFVNTWEFFDQVIVTMDSIKPIDSRQGWTDERLAEYNQRRFEDLISAGWDLIIVDEAHKMGGSSENIARHQLGKGLSESTPNLLLLTATPHQGKTDAFLRLMRLLDPMLFPDGVAINKEKVKLFTIRTEKRQAIDVNGEPIFTPRSTSLKPVSWQARHEQQAMLYELVTNYVKEGYNQALTDKKYYIGFLMVLMQRLVVSSTRAIRMSLTRRLQVLNQEIYGEDISPVFLENLEDIYDLDGQELLDQILEMRESAAQDERDEVALLLQQARKVEQTETDVKTEALLETIYSLQTQERDPDVKVLIFTEFIATQDMLSDYLRNRGFSVVKLNGTMSMGERRQAQVDFSQGARVMISTDAGGEGLNLQFCHLVINYDIPWNPMRLEQRIGRVDRIGQTKPVTAINFVFEDSIEFRVREVLEEKLQIIYQEFGIDKTSDVLDSGQAGKLFEQAFMKSISKPEMLEKYVDDSLQEFRAEVEEVLQNAIIRSIGASPNIEGAKRVKYHPLPHWTETMVIAYYRSKGANAINMGSHWEVVNQDDMMRRRLSFMKTGDLFGGVQGTQTISIESEEVQQLIEKLPQFVQGLHVPRITIPGIPEKATGFFGLFEVGISYRVDSQTSTLRMPQQRRIISPIFVSDDGKVFIPTAQRIWDKLVSENIGVEEFLSEEESEQAYEKILELMQKRGETDYQQLRQEHHLWLENEKERGQTYFSAKENGIMKIGLPEVRNYRLNKLSEERKLWSTELEGAAAVIPTLKVVLLLRVGENNDR